MRHFFYLLMIFVLLVPGYSQGSKVVDAATKLDSKEKASLLIDQVCKEYESYKSMKVNFVLTTLINGYPRSIDTIKGQVQNNSYRLSMPDQEIACNGKTVWYYYRKQKVVKKAEPNPADINLAFPHKMLRRYQKEYDYKWMGEAKLGKHDIHKVDFYPNNPNQEISKIRVYIDKSSSQVLSITSYGKNGTSYKLDFRNVLYNVKIDPKVFVMEMS